MRTFENVLVKTSVVPSSAVAGAINGAAVDTEGFGDAVAIVTVGATTGTPTSFTVDGKVQESADGSTGWTDVTGAVITAVTVASKTAEIAIDTDKKALSKRYIRLVVTPAFVGGTAPTIGVAGVVVLGKPDRGPVSNSGVGN